MLIVFSGLPGTGKTTIASDLAARTSAVYLRIDTIEQTIRDSGALAQDVGRSGYTVANELALRGLCRLSMGTKPPFERFMAIIDIRKDNGHYQQTQHC